MSLKEKASSLLALLDKEEEDKKKKEKELPKTLEGKIEFLYKYCCEKALEKDPENQIVITYVKDLYNPETSKLDKINLYFNLLFLSNLFKYHVMEFNFDEDLNNITTNEYHLSMENFKDAMEKEYQDENMRYVDILEKRLEHAFNRRMLDSLATQADTKSYNERQLKMRNLTNSLSDSSKKDMDLEEYLMEFIEKNTSEGSIIMATPDITPHFSLSEKNESVSDKDEHIIYKGVWENRFVNEINLEACNLKGFKKGAFFMKKGYNRYELNPEKPIVYFNVIENPFLEKPVLKLFTNYAFRFSKNSATFLRIDM